MRAAQICTLEGPGSLRVSEVADPVPAENQVLIRVRSAGVSFPEVLQSRGRYQIQPELPFVPGSEVAGEVVSAPSWSGLQLGDRVAAFTFLGGLAELAVADEDDTFPMPDGLSFDEAAAIPLNYFTAHVAIKYRGRFEAGESVLVHGAAGGVGTASIQVAKALGASRVVAIVSSDAKADVARAAGADECVPVQGFREAVCDTGKVDVVVDPVGGDRFIDSLRCLQPNGRLLVVGFTSGGIPSVPANRLLLNNLDVVGVAWGSYARHRPGFLAAQWDELMGYFADGVVRPPIGGVYPLDGIGAALHAIDDRVACGKIIVSPSL